MNPRSPERSAPVPVLLLIRKLESGGSERQLAEVARSLDRRRFEPHVGVLHGGGIRTADVEGAGVPVTVFPVPSFKKPGFFTAGLALMRYVRRHRIRIVHPFDVPANLFGVPFARMAGVPHIIASQRAHRDLVGPVMRGGLRLVDRLATATVVNCEYLRRHLVEDYGVPDQSIHLCYNGIDTLRFRTDPAHVRPAGLEEGSLVVGSICALRPEKDLATLLRAFARIPDRPPGVRLLIGGGGPCAVELRELAAELGIEQSVYFAGEQRDVVPWMRSLDIFVLPSLSEAFSNSIMEAMACGACVVASEVGGNPELVRHGETGLLFSKGDVDVLSGHLARLIADAELRRRLARHGHDRIHSEFTLSHAADRMAEIYTGLITGRNRGE